METFYHQADKKMIISTKNYIKSLFVLKFVLFLSRILTNKTPKKMKKLSILFLTIITLGLSVSSCSNDDENNASIEGKWELTQEGAILNGREILQAVTNEGGCSNEIYEYMKDGSFTNTYSELSNSKCTTFTDKGTWTKNGNTLTEKYQGDSESDSYTIINLSNSELKIKEVFTDSGITLEFVRVFKRI